MAIADKRLAEIFAEDWKWRLKEFPEFGTFVGSHEQDDRLDDRDPDAYARREKKLRETIAELDKIDVNTLNDADKLNHTILRSQCTTFADGLKYPTWQMLVNRMEGPQTDVINVFQRMPVATQQDWDKVFARLKAIPRQNDQILESLKVGLQTGMTPARIAMVGVVDQLRSITKGNPADLGIIPDSNDTANKEKAFELIKTLVQPSFEKVANFIEQEYIPKLRPESDIACTSLPNGKEFYKALIRFHTDDKDATCESVHELGVTKCKEIMAEMEKCVEKIGFKGTVKEFVQHIYKDPQFFVDTPKKLMAHYQKLYDEILPKLPTYFGEIPPVGFKIVETPKSAAEQAPAAYYYAPAADGSRPGTVYVNTFSLPARPLFETNSLALHEGVPGHHLQAAFGVSLKDAPLQRTTMEDRLYAQSPARYPLGASFAEGWALYCESLGLEMDMYKNSYEYFGYLNMNALRACRLVVDTGMHGLGWTRQKAIDWCVQYAPGLSLHNIEAEVDRYIAWPGQALAYKTGELNLVKLRKEAEAALGDKFNLADFHRTVLSQGHLGVDIIAILVRDWIKKQSGK